MRKSRFNEELEICSSPGLEDTIASAMALERSVR